MLLSLLFVMSAYATEFKLNYKFKETHLIITTDSKDYNEAIEFGSTKCLRFYLNMFKISRLTEDEKIGLANVCTNPR